MISNLIAFYISHRLQRVPIYEAISLQDGVHLPAGESRGRGGARVGDAMRPVPERVTPDVRVGEAAADARDRALEAWPSVDHEGFQGMVRAADLETAVASGMGDRPVGEVQTALASGARMPSASHLHADHSLSLALERMGTSGMRLLPVISRATCVN
jgi:chloride channel protein, CIC family